MTQGSAVVSGTDVAAVVGALEGRGFAVRVAADAERLRELALELGPGSQDCYVQLPVEIPARGSTAVELVRNFLTDGLMARFDDAAAILPALRDGASVLLVGGNHPGSTSAPDNPEARRALMKVLAHALLLERAGNLSVTVVDSPQGPAELAALAAGEQAVPLRVVGEDLADMAPEFDYSDWRNAIMSLTSTQA